MLQSCVFEITILHGFRNETILRGTVRPSSVLAKTVDTQQQQQQQQQTFLLGGAQL